MPSTNMNKAGFAGAMDKMTAGLASGMQNREQAQLEKEQNTYQLNMAKEMNKEEVWKEEARGAKLAAEETTRKLQKENMFRGLKYFTEDKNPRHLNALLKGGPMSKSGIIRFAKIDPNADKALIASAGMDPDDVSGETVIGEGKTSQGAAYDSYGDNARFVKGIMQDGSEKIFDVYKVKQMTGYFQSLTDENVAKELALNEGNNGYAPGEWEKKANLVASQGVDTKKGAVSSLYNDMKTGNIGGKVEAAEAAEQELDKAFDGSFVANFDPNDPEQRAQVESHVEKIEAMRGISYSASEMKELNDLSVLIGLGTPGAELTDEETGFFDNTLFNVKKYFSDEGGTGANEAYAAYRNSLRNALYGSALTEHEIAAFNEQLGGLKMKRGPLIQQMLTSMGQVEAKLNNIYNLNNSYSASFRLGVNRSKLADIIGALKENQKRIKDLSSGAATGKTKAQRITDLQGQL